ncbi:ATP-binding protein [Luteitalea sp.]
MGPEAAPWRNALQATTASAAVDTPAPGGAPVRDLGQIESALDHHAILAITDQRGRIVHVNDHFCAISKYRRDELLGRDQRLINSGTHSREFMRHLWRTITGGTVWHGEICNRAKDGTLYWVETTIYPVAGPHGSPVQYVSLRTDISRRKFAEARAREERDRAALLARDAIKASQAKSDFLATMSHEIRTPLNGVLGFTTLLTETTLNEDQRLCVDTIHSSGQALLEIVNDILDYSKIESGRLVLERAPYDLHALIADVVARHEVRATEKGVSLRIVDGDAPTYLMGDEGRVRQVLINLVSNAVKFTPCGAVTVAASRHDHAVRVTVTDTGIGIPADRVDRLFQPFSQADGSTTRRFGGTGLGLAISRHLVELMGGRIGVESDESTGSTFWFDVPDTSPEGTHAQGALTEAQRALPGGRPAGRRLRVLVADDVPVNRLLAKRILESLDASVELAANGSQAVAMAVLAPYDLILMDCHMPMMDGYAAARAIRSHEAEAHSVATPIVALTANVMDRQRDDCRAAGMDDVVVKPITKAALAGALTRWT